MTSVRYDGPGEELFIDLHWQPQPGEVRDFPEHLAADPDRPLNHPHLTVLAPPAPAAEDEQAATTATSEIADAAGRPGKSAGKASKETA
jgi:hypothetical protein